jgi:hypothetical protein
MRLAMAHVDLAKAEAKAIGVEIARVAAYVGIAIAALLSMGIVMVVGTSLFLGEWLLGSIGWGVLHGILFFISIAIAAALLAIGVGGSRVGRALLAAVVIGVVVAILLGLALPNRAYRSLGDGALTGVESGVRPLVIAMLIVGAIGLLLGLIAAIRRRGGFSLGPLLGGLVAGVVIGAISALEVPVQVGVGIGIAVGYLAWVALMGLDAARTGVDLEALKARFYPTQTIETSKETLAWLQSKMPPGIGS